MLGFDLPAPRGYCKSYCMTRPQPLSDSTIRNIKPGDRITAIERVVGIEEKESQFSGRLVLQYVEASYYNQRSELVAWAKIGVAAAEQIYVGQGRGDEKKQYVLEFLKSKGFDLNEESVNNAIEAAVKQLNTEGLLID